MKLIAIPLVAALCLVGCTKSGATAGVAVGTLFCDGALLYFDAPLEPFCAKAQEIADALIALSSLPARRGAPPSNLEIRDEILRQRAAKAAEMTEIPIAVHIVDERAAGLVRPTVAIINATTVLPDSDFPAYVAAQQKQIDYDFAPLWGKAAHLVFVPKGGTPPPNAWQMAFLDDADQAGALGYHDVTADGHPLGKVFVKTTQTYGGIWTVTGSHECLEMLGDPDISRCVFIQTTNSTGTIYAYEAGDAVEADDLGYAVDGVVLSDFVTNEWFDPGHYATAAGYSFKKHVNAPLQLAPGGYIGYFKVGSGSGWRQKTASLHEASPSLHLGDWPGCRPAAHQLPAPGSRRERRARGRHAWSASTAHLAP